MKSVNLVEIAGEERYTVPMIAVDDLLPCLIYVFVKSETVDLPAYLSLIECFTLEKRQHEFEFLKSNLQAVI